ncbi:hypothetical protein [Streptomyces olivoreticuli]|uniref:hypothetical protein n=1 Tax=Streptomyces olivoreticuli TaxID=68246 RepID=UPI0013C2E104|nr:hypothetical protein [Streptomyces olivoreticuli]
MPATVPVHPGEPPRGAGTGGTLPRARTAPKGGRAGHRGRSREQDRGRRAAPRRDQRATGRTGVAITHTYRNSRQEWISDADTYECLGRREVLVEPYRGLEPGAVTSESVVVKRAVVNAKKELPGGGTLNSGG